MELFFDTLLSSSTISRERTEDYLHQRGTKKKGKTSKKKHASSSVTKQIVVFADNDDSDSRN